MKLKSHDKGERDFTSQHCYALAPTAVSEGAHKAVYMIQ